MSNILKDKNELIELSSIIKYLNNHELDVDYINEVLKLLIPKKNGNDLIKTHITNKGFTTAIFTPQSECLRGSLDKINNWLYLNTKDFAEMYQVKDIKLLRSYLFLFILAHEIEHSYEYLMGECIIEAPSKTIAQGYKGIFDLFFRNESIIPRPIKETRRLISLILYKRMENYYILERNANIEATDLLSELALFQEHDDIFKMFNDMKNAFTSMGYRNDTKGCLEATYLDILLYNKYKRFYEESTMTEEENARYGLHITEETREKILKNI